MKENYLSNNNEDNNNINENEEENKEEEEPEIDEDNNDNPEDSILFCHDRFCTSIPEIYFDENSSLVYLFCNRNKKKEKHKYCLNINEYLKNNNLLSNTKLKKIEKNKKDLDDNIIKDIEGMINKIKHQKKHLEKITNVFNDLIRNIVDDYTFLLQNKLSSLIFQKKIINTYINCPEDINAIKNFQSLSNYMNNISISTFLELEKCSKTEINNNNKEKEKRDNITNIKDTLKRVSNLSNIFNYFSNTSHKLMSVNNNILDRDINRINNMIVLKNGNLCISSDLSVFAIYNLNKDNQRYEQISEIIPIKNCSINYITQLSNELLVCCSKKLIIGELTDEDTKYNIIQTMDEFDNYSTVKVIELSNNYLATYDRGFQINIFTPVYNGDNNNIEYQLIFKRINKGEQLCSLLALPQNDINDVQYVSTSNYHYTTGKNCVKFYSSKKDYQCFDTIYDLSCSDFVNSLIMINKKILAIGIRNSYHFGTSNSNENGIVLIDIKFRQVVTFIESEFPTAMYKLSNDLFVIACNKSNDETDSLVPQKKINFYYIDEDFGSKDNLTYISSINSGTKEFVSSIAECHYYGKLIVSGNSTVRGFQ